MSNFTTMDTLRLSLWRADLVLEIDLQEIFEAISSTCSLTRFGNSTMPVTIQAHLQEICDYDVHTWNTFHDFLTGTADRRPRFLLATLLSSVVMGVGGYIFGSSHSSDQTDTQLMANQEHFVQLFRENDHRAMLMQKEIGKLTQYVTRSSMHTKQFLVVLSILFLQAKQLAVIFRALETLILDKKLAPGLIAPDLLHEKYGHLQQQLSEQGKHLSITTELDLFNCPASFATFTDHTLRIVVHVPVFDDRLGDFTLYNYQNLPWKSGPEFYQVSDDSPHYIAVSKSHEYHFYARTLDLDRCTAMSSFLSCSHFGGLYTKVAPSCLWGLFSSDDAMVHRMCSLRTMGKDDRFWPLINNKFAIFLGTADTIFIRCRGKIVDSAHFSGLKTVAVPPDCMAEGRSFRFYAGSRVVEEDALLKLAPVSLDPATFRGPHSFNDSQADELLRDSARDVHIPTRVAVIPVHPVTYVGLYCGLAAVGAVGLTVLALFVKWKRQPVPESAPA